MMTLDRVITYISKHQDNTIVYLEAGTVRCASVKHKSFKTIIANKRNKYTVIGVYSNGVPAKHIEEDLISVGVRE